MKRNPAFDCNVCVTGQHREMLRQVLDVFGVEPDMDLALMQPNQSLAELTSRAIVSLDKYLDREKPDAVMVQGDTTTVLCASLAAFYRHIPVAHVEAGLRTWNLDSPWPEEGNRKLASRLTRWHFAPTESNRRNLLRDGIDGARIFVTGNTVIDTLLLARAMACRNPPPVSGLPDDGRSFPGRDRMVMITGHRRENFGKGFEHICRSIRLLAERNPDVQFIYPVHLNTNVREPVFRILGEAAPENIHLIAPQGYLSFVSLMDRATLLLTDGWRSRRGTKPRQARPRHAGYDGTPGSRQSGNGQTCRNENRRNRQLRFIVAG